MVLYAIDDFVDEKRRVGVNRNNALRLRNHEVVTEREQEVLQMMSEGLTVKEIARSLNLSPHTVVSHKKNLSERFQTRNSIDLIVKMIKLGYVKM